MFLSEHVKDVDSMIDDDEISISSCAAGGSGGGGGDLMVFSDLKSANDALEFSIYGFMVMICKSRRERR
jgi:hypothetical protein